MQTVRLPGRAALFGVGSRVAGKNVPLLFVAAGAASVILVNAVLDRVERPVTSYERVGGEPSARMAIVRPGDPPGGGSLMAWLGLDKPFEGMAFESGGDSGSWDDPQGAAGAGWPGPGGVAIAPLAIDLSAGRGLDLLVAAEEVATLAELGDEQRDLSGGSGTLLAALTAPLVTDGLATGELDQLGFPAGDQPVGAMPIAPSALPVPEPTVWLQLIAGAGLIAFVLRRRNRRMHAAPALR